MRHWDRLFISDNFAHAEHNNASQNTNNPHTCDRGKGHRNSQHAERSRRRRPRRAADALVTSMPPLCVTKLARLPCRREIIGRRQPRLQLAEAGGVRSSARPGLGCHLAPKHLALSQIWSSAAFMVRLRRSLRASPHAVAELFDTALHTPVGSTAVTTCCCSPLQQLGRYRRQAHR